MVSKSLDNIVGNLWQARQESSGSSMGNQVSIVPKKLGHLLGNIKNISNNRTTCCNW